MSGAEALVTDAMELKAFSPSGRVPLVRGELLVVTFRRLGLREDEVDGDAVPDPWPAARVFYEAVYRCDGFAINGDDQVVVKLERSETEFAARASLRIDPTVRYRGSGADLARDIVRLLELDPLELRRFLDECRHMQLGLEAMERVGLEDPDSER